MTDRRKFLQTTAATAAALALPRWTHATAAPSDLDPIFAEIQSATTNPSSACKPGFTNRPSPQKIAG